LKDFGLNDINIYEFFNSNDEKLNIINVI